jgi:hypothetical protein
MDAANTTAEAMREAAEGQRVLTPRGAVGTDAGVGVASLARAGSPGRAFVEAGLAMHPRASGAPSVGRFGRRRASGASDVHLGQS